MKREGRREKREGRREMGERMEANPVLLVAAIW